MMNPLILNHWSPSDRSARKGRSAVPADHMLKPEKKESGTPSAPYSQLSEIYDYVMRHVDYVHWADYVQSVFTRCKTTPETILELACGTGSMAEILTNRGYHVTGVDKSEGMVAVAQQRAAESGISAVFKQGDMIDPPVPNDSCDAVLCLYDSINYLMDTDALNRMLTGVQARLHADGIFIFDACTEINSRRFFDNEVDQESTDDFSYIRHSEYLAAERIQVNAFQLVFRHDGQIKTYFERHEQRIYPVEQLKKLCKEAGFRDVEAFDGFTFKRATEKSNRVHFVMRSV